MKCSNADYSYTDGSILEPPHCIQSAKTKNERCNYYGREEKCPYFEEE